MYKKLLTTTLIIALCNLVGPAMASTNNYEYRASYNYNGSTAPVNLITDTAYAGANTIEFVDCVGNDGENCGEKASGAAITGLGITVGLLDSYLSGFNN